MSYYHQVMMVACDLQEHKTDQGDGTEDEAVLSKDSTGSTWRLSWGWEAGGIAGNVGWWWWSVSWAAGRYGFNDGTDSRWWYIDGTGIGRAVDWGWRVGRRGGVGRRSRVSSRGSIWR